MACTITITNAFGVGSPVPSEVHVEGTATDCKEVRVLLSCATPPGNELVVPVAANGDWSAVFTQVGDCKCNEVVRIRVVCTTDPACQITQSRDLPCREEAGCPTVSNVTVQIGPCNPNGTRNVTLSATITPLPGPVVAQWDFGDGTFGPAFVIPVGPPVTHTEVHAYLPPGPYTATLVITLPQHCDPHSITIGPLDDCAVNCPKVVGLSASVFGCAGGSHSASVTFTGTVVPFSSTCTFKWDFGDGGPAVITANPTVTHVYTAPNSYAVAVIAICGGVCIEPATIVVVVPPCCPVLTGLGGTVNGCAGGGSSATVTFVATTDPGAAAGIYTWTFDDGTLPQVTAAPTITHSYNTPGTKTVQVSLMPSMPGMTCDPTTISTSVAVPTCSNGSHGGNGNGGSGLCGSFTYIIAALLGLTLAVAILIGTLYCVGIPVPTVVLGIVLGLGIAVAAAIAIAYILCGLGICPCLSSCDWLAITWMSTLIGAIVALFLAGCCPAMYWVAAGLGAAALATFGTWAFRCKPSACDVLTHLLVALASGAAVAISYLGLIPPIAACATSLVLAVVSTLTGIVTVAVAACKS